METPGAPPSSSSLADPSRRFKVIALSLLASYVLIISRGEGEFWPFSKFPMFSRSGRPWNRSYVSEVSAAEAAGPLGEVWEKEVPGRPVALHHFRINQDDLSAVVRSLKPPLSAEQTDFLATYFDRIRHDKTMILYSVVGRFRPDRTVRERFTPLAIIGPEGVRNVPSADPASAEAGVSASDAALAPDAGVPSP